MLLFVVASVVSAGLVGTLLGALGASLDAARPLALSIIAGVSVVIATAYGVAEVRGITWPVPSRHWQVPRRWGRSGRPLFASAFGLLLGPGFFTFVTFVGYYLVLAACILAADPRRGCVLMAVYGATRTLPVLIAPLVAWGRGQIYAPESALAVNDWIESLEPRLGWLRANVLFAAAGAALATILLRH